MRVPRKERSILRPGQTCRPRRRGEIIGRDLDGRGPLDRNTEHRTGLGQQTTDQPAEGPNPQQERVLRRPTDGRVLGGVTAAVAGRFGIDVTAVRTGFVVLAPFGGTPVPLYAAGWLLIPEQGAELSIGQELARNRRRQ